MKKEQDDPGRAIALALVFFGALAVLGAAAGVHERLSGGTLAALALFAVGFAAATYRLDASVRGWVDARLAAARGRFRKAPAKSPAPKRAAT